MLLFLTCLLTLVESDPVNYCAKYSHNSTWEGAPWGFTRDSEFPLGFRRGSLFLTDDESSLCLTIPNAKDRRIEVMMEAMGGVQNSICVRDMYEGHLTRICDFQKVRQCFQFDYKVGPYSMLQDLQIMFFCKDKCSKAGQGFYYRIRESEPNPDKKWCNSVENVNTSHGQWPSDVMAPKFIDDNDYSTPPPPPARSAPASTNLTVAVAGVTVGLGLLLTAFVWVVMRRRRMHSRLQLTDDQTTSGRSVQMSTKIAVGPDSSADTLEPSSAGMQKMTIGEV